MSSKRQTYLRDLQKHQPGQPFDQQEIDELAMRISKGRRAGIITTFSSVAVALLAAWAFLSFGLDIFTATFAAVVVMCVLFWSHVPKDQLTAAEELPVSLQSASPMAHAIYRLGAAQLTPADIRELKDWAEIDPDAKPVFARWNALNIKLYERDARMLRRYLYTCPMQRESAINV